MLEGDTEFLERKLQLKVNRQKSAVAFVGERKFLGYRILAGGRLSIAPASLKRAKDRIKKITSRRRGKALKSIVEERNEFTRGWVQYFRYAQATKLLRETDKWIRRKLRCYRLKQCKQSRAITSFFRSLGASEAEVKAAGSGRRWWYASD